MMVREKRDIRPVLLKVGVALALSFAGFLYSRLRTRKIRPSAPPPSLRSSDPSGEVSSGKGGRARIKQAPHSSPKRSSSCNVVAIAEEKFEETYIQKFVTENSTVGPSPSSSRHSGDKDGFLLPEFNDLVKEFDFSAAVAENSPRKNVETPRSDTASPKTFRGAEKDDYEQEIRHLSNLVRILREREKNLESQLLEYYGLKEQETAVMELQNRLKINNMEAKLFSLKIESLRADNRRLETQVADHAKVVNELDAARTKIRLLKKKLKSETEQNKEHILTLKQRVSQLQDKEYKAAAIDRDSLLKLQMLKDLEGEAEELRKSNLRLQIENSDLAQRLESTQIIATSVLEDPETEVLKELSERLRRENEDLGKEIEQLQADRCTDTEELVYLRWINACLRYELRNYQPPHSRTPARDLSKTLSPKSEEKAKQLILEYANIEGIGDKAINNMDFDSDRWSSSQASMTDFGECDDSSVDNSSTTKTNTSSRVKFLSKLRKLIRGKDKLPPNRASSVDKIGCLEDGDSPLCSSTFSTGIDGGASGHSNRITTPSQNSSRHSLDITRGKSLKVEDIKDLASVQRNSDEGSFYRYKRFSLDIEAATNLMPDNQPDQDTYSSQKSELVKYAEVLMDSRGGTPKYHRKSASYGSVHSCNL